MIDVRFKNEELLDLYSILIKFSDRLENQDVLEVVHQNLIDILEQVAPEKEDKQIENESCLEKVQSFKKWYDQQLVKIEELKTQDVMCKCAHDKHNIVDDLNTKCNSNISGGTYVDTKNVQSVALNEMKKPSFKDALESCINDPTTVQNAQETIAIESLVNGLEDK
jgi:hypothetical protein